MNSITRFVARSVAGVTLSCFVLALSPAWGQIPATAKPVITMEPLTSGPVTSGPAAGDFFVIVPLKNTGTANASNLEITSATFGTAPLLSPSLPVVLGTLTVGSSSVVTFTFDGSTLTAGDSYVLTIEGTYNTGTKFKLTRDVEAGVYLPQYTIYTQASSKSGGTTLDGVGVAADASGDLYATARVPYADVKGESFTAIVEINKSPYAPVVGSQNPSAPFPGCGMAATSIFMTDLGGLAVDAAGDIFVAQSGNGPILDVVDGTVNCLLGAEYFFSNGVAPDNAGNVYFSVPQSSIVNEATASDSLVTAAGDGTTGCTGAEIGKPFGLAVDAQNNLYISDEWCNVIWEVNSSGISVVAGTPGTSSGFSGDGGPATAAVLGSPAGVAVDAAGNIYIADRYNARVRKVSNGIIYTIAGDGTVGNTGSGVLATDGELIWPTSVAVSPVTHAVYIGEAQGAGTQEIRKLITKY